jgi:hypothetical protein
VKKILAQIRKVPLNLMQEENKLDDAREAV